MNLEQEPTEIPAAVLAHRAIGEFIYRYIISNDAFPKTVAPQHPPFFVETFLTINRHGDRVEEIRFAGPNPEYANTNSDGFACNIYWKQPNKSNVLYRKQPDTDNNTIDAYALIASWGIYSINPNTLPQNVLTLFKVYPLTQVPDPYIRTSLSPREAKLVEASQNFQKDETRAIYESQSHPPARNRYDVERELQLDNNWQEFMLDILHTVSVEYADSGMPEGGFRRFLAEYILKHKRKPNENP